MNPLHPIRTISLVAAMLLPTFASQAVAPIAMPDAPLYLAGGVAPNLVVTLDDSGSMTWGYVPDSVGKYAKVESECKDNGTKDFSIFYGYDSGNATGNITYRYFLSGDHNAQYYNPGTTYLAPLKSDGTPYSTTFTTAHRNGFDPGTSLDLSSAYQPSFGFQPQSNECYAKHPAIDSGAGKQFNSDEAKVPAYYYVYQIGGTGCTGASISKTNEACYVYTAVGVTEQQNFANWYSFYRTRNLATVSAATRAFNNLPSSMRLGWQALNSSCDDFTGTGCQGWDSVKVNNSIRALSAAGHKENFFKWLEKMPANGSTPLRQALGRVGNYYSTAASTTNMNSPYAEDPQVKVGTVHSCRANYTILMTDGIWNGNNAGAPYPGGNTDTAAPKPFSDTTSNTLADVAYYYWNTDLRTDLTNNVARNPRALDKLVEEGKTIPAADYDNAKYDPANWQHMVTYTVGLGLTTTFPTLGLTWGGDTYLGSYTDLVSGAKSWPAASSDSANNVADLWHAAINGRGLFFSAEDPKSLSESLQEMVNNIISRSASAASIATNSKRLDTSTNIYQASFDSGNWTGELEAFAVNSDGTLGASQWTASTKIPAAASRNIKTWNGSAGIDFSGALGSLTVGEVDYLRGDQSNEQSLGGIFRTRTSLLGDIVNSDPLFVSEDNFGYDKLTGAEGTNYVAYLAAKKKKAAMIYVGANDGMLHGFDVSVVWTDKYPLIDTDGDGDPANDPDIASPSPKNGTELFAYVPKLVYPTLPELTKPNYAHKYFVDGGPVSGDVYYGGSAWKTVLVTPLGAGGRGVFAIDVSKDFSKTSFAGLDVLWEFDGASSSSTLDDMGYPVGSASIGRFQDGKYYAVFGNGYGSASCKSGLFMVQIDSPSNVKYFPTGVGDCTSVATQNGMSTPSLVDYDGDRIIDAVFAGDLKGNLWKFDVADSNSAFWAIALNKPMFTSPTAQAITAPVEVGKAPSSATGKAMVYFGTGRYLLSGDESDKTKQTFYGLLDDGTQITGLNKLQQQSIVYESATARVVTTAAVTWTAKQGWYLDLVAPPSSTLQGERVLSVPLLRYGRVIFNTSIPSADPCVLGGTGWLMELDAATGGNLSYSALDMNNDGLFNASDNVTYKDAQNKDVTSSVAGKKSGSMSLNQPTVIQAGSTEYKFNSDIKKGISVTTEKGGTSNPRSSWRQLQ
ncbi:MAG: PilC/PilY family type IV pilus protein [Thiobacillus sp.]|nr:PilC/PilY family type IV pilus protein [Thiobacillus sp.]